MVLLVIPMSTAERLRGSASGDSPSERPERASLARALLNSRSSRTGFQQRLRTEASMPKVGLRSATSLAEATAHRGAAQRAGILPGLASLKLTWAAYGIAQVSAQDDKVFDWWCWCTKARD